ncbi:ABC-F family ATP-binding cassette domain-containing protein [Microbacteriaceae bacterium VKM Ac-2855]|nr:ABC-F family ATP-binding cassette domain-containing protein [Microbacteriaceae bacterium VKM Ac-2855]
MTAIHSRTSAPTVAVDHLRAVGVSHGYGDRRVLADVELVVAPGRRIGLIGENGAGKSTLLRVLAGVERPERGEVQRPRRTGLLWQEPPLTSTATVDDVFERELTELRAIEGELEAAAVALADPDPAAERRYQNALAAAEAADIWGIDTRRATLAAGFGVAELDRRRTLDSLSGGQRSRVTLAALLLGRPDALLLDEPTNHLDDEAIETLSEELRSWRGPVLFASHDRAFLDAVATGLADLDPTVAGGVAMFGSGAETGVYTRLLQHKAAERVRWEQRYRAEQDELERLRDSVDVTSRRVGHAKPMADRNKMSYGTIGNRVQGQISRRVRNARNRLDELSGTTIPEPPEPLHFGGLPHGFAAPADPGPILQVRSAVVEGRLSVDGLTVAPDARLLVTGPNGAGKSTLLALLAGALRPDAGEVLRRRGARIGLLQQDVAFAEPQRTPRQQYERVLGERRAEAVPLRSLGLIAPGDLDRPLGTLSVGQRRRFALALVIARPPHLFLLDEPGNHLSLALATELEEALGGYPGAVVVASHDRWTGSHWHGESLEVSKGEVTGTAAY